MEPDVLGFFCPDCKTRILVHAIVIRGIHATLIAICNDCEKRIPVLVDQLIANQIGSHFTEGNNTLH